MGVSVLVCNTAYARAELHFQTYNNGPNEPKRNEKYNLHYGEVRKDVLRPPHGTKTSFNEVI